MSDQDIFSGVREVTVEPPEYADAMPGVVVKWRRRGDVWEGLVSREVDGKVTTEWLPALLLNPTDSS